MRVEEGEADEPNGVDLLGIELELRRIVGVVSARVEHRADGQILAVSLAVVGSTAGVAEAAVAATRPYFEGAVDIYVIEIAPPAAPPEVRTAERVRLVGVYGQAGDPRVEVHLAHGDRQAVGRSADRRLVGVARATMTALRSLGADLPFEIEAITNLGAGETGPVLVRLAGGDGGSTRLGVVAAEDGYQATVKALLHALNRHLEAAFAPGGDGGEAKVEAAPLEAAPALAG